MKNTSLSDLFLRYEKVLFIVGGIFLALITWVFIIPSIKNVFEVKKNLDQEKIRFNRLQAKLTDLKTLNEFELTERVNLSLKAIPDRKNVMAVMTNLRTQAAEMGLVIQNLHVSPGELQASISAKPTIDKLNFNLEINGPLNLILDFFKKIENSLPLISLNRVKIELSKETAIVNLILESYFLPFPETLGTIDSPVPKLTPDEEKVLGEVSGYSLLPPVSFPPPAGRANPFSF